MYRTLYVMALVALCAELAHSFSWDIVTGVGSQLEFIDINGTVTHTENLTLALMDIYEIYHITHDPVHNRVLFTNLQHLYSFDIAKNKTECLLKNTTYSSLAYDPATELLFLSENYENIYSTSLKPEFNNSKIIEKRLILNKDRILIMAVDSCGGFIYWHEVWSRPQSALNSNVVYYVYRAQFNGSEKEFLFESENYIYSLTIDQHSQKMYWSEEGFIKSADLNGNNIRTVTRSTHYIFYLTISKDFIYCAYSNDDIDKKEKYGIIQIPKDSSHGMKTKPKIFIRFEDLISMAANYNIEDIIQENQNCDTLKSLLTDKSVSTDNPVSSLYVNGTKVSGESRSECTQGSISGERLNVSVCDNYCLHGDCSASAEGQPKCSCDAGYSGERCQVDVCRGYCLNDGVCFLSQKSKPLCRCAGHYAGERCDVPILQIKSLGGAVRVFTSCILLPVYLSLNVI